MRSSSPEERAARLEMGLRTELGDPTGNGRRAGMRFVHGREDSMFSKLMQEKSCTEKYFINTGTGNGPPLSGPHGGAMGKGATRQSLYSDRHGPRGRLQQTLTP